MSTVAVARRPVLLFPAWLLALLLGWPAVTISSAQAVREVRLSARKFAFEPARIEVAQGDTVRLVVTSLDTAHGVRIKRLNVEREVPRGETVTVEFVAREAGTFELACAEWCGKGHKSMKATLVVHPSAGPREASTR